MKIEVDQNTGKFKLAFGYKKELVEAIKGLPDRRYNPNTKEWTVGFDESNLGEIMAILAGNNWPNEMLNQAEKEAKEYLAKNPAESLTSNEFEALVKPMLQLLGEIVIDAYKADKINQKEQAELIDIINHISLKDFITK